MFIPDYQKILLPVLKLANTGEIKVSDAVNQISDEFKLSDEEKQTMIPSGRMPIIRNRVGWSVTYLVKAGLLIRSQRGYFTIRQRKRGSFQKT